MRFLDENINKKGYGFISKILHWSIALLVMFQFLKFFDNTGENAISAFIKPYHGSIGILILFLVCIRVAWSLVNLKYRKENNVLMLAKIGHFALYCLMFLTPISAILLVVGKGWGVKFFGYELISGDKNEMLVNLGQYHSMLAILFILLVFGHAVAAFLHYKKIKNAKNEEKAFKM